MRDFGIHIMWCDDFEMIIIMEKPLKFNQLPGRIGCFGNIYNGHAFPSWLYMYSGFGRDRRLGTKEIGQVSCLVASSITTCHMGSVLTN